MDDQEDSDKGQEVGQGRTLAFACARHFHATLSYKSVFLPNKLLGNFSFIIFEILHVKLWLHIKYLTVPKFKKIRFPLTNIAFLHAESGRPYNMKIIDQRRRVINL